MRVLATVEGTAVVLVSWVATGLMMYAAIRRAQSGRGCFSSILWLIWTAVWVGILAAMAVSLIGTTGPLVVYLSYVAWQINAITQVQRADRVFTSQYGSLTRYRVKYLGGHPDFRTANTQATLLVTQAGLILLDRYHPRARTLCNVPIDQVSKAEAHGTTNRTVAWFSDMPLPMTFTSDRGTLAVQFVNDVGLLSVALFDVGSAGMAQTLKTKVDYAVYDWRRSCTGGS